MVRLRCSLEEILRNVTATCSKCVHTTIMQSFAFVRVRVAAFSFAKDCKNMSSRVQGAQVIIYPDDGNRVDYQIPTSRSAD